MAISWGPRPLYTTWRDCSTPRSVIRSVHKGKGGVVTGGMSGAEGVWSHESAEGVWSQELLRGCGYIQCVERGVMGDPMFYSSSFKWKMRS